MKPRFARTFTDKLRGTKTMLLGGRPALDLVCRHVVHEHRSLTWHKGLLHDKGGQIGVCEGVRLLGAFEEDREYSP